VALRVREFVQEFRKVSRREVPLVHRVVNQPCRVLRVVRKSGGFDLPQDLEDVVTSYAPLGPPSSEGIPPNLRSFFYDDTIRTHRERSAYGSCILIGRKGAGKTSLLFGSMASPFDAVVLAEDDLFNYVTTVIRAVEKRQTRCSVDHVAEIWHAAFRVAAAICLVSGHKTTDSDLVRFVAGTLGKHPDLDHAASESSLRSSFSAGLARFLGELAQAIADGTGMLDLQTALSDLTFGGVPFRRVVTGLEQLYKSKGGKLPILVDSLEELGDAFQDYKQAIKGLLRLIGLRLQQDRSIEVVVCFPQEVEFKDVSTNPIKDSARTVEVSWSSRELLALLGRRLHVGISLLDPGTAERLPVTRWTPDSETLSSPEAIDLLKMVFPETVINAFGEPEPTFSYIMRHTQLLPRHAIWLANAILEDQLASHGTLNHVDPALISSAINRKEGDVAEDILAAYSERFRSIEMILEEVIPHLGLTFDWPELHKAYNRSVLRREFSIDEFVKMAETMGVFGRQISDNHRYIEADFSYAAAAGPLRLQSHDRICLHPVFAKYFRSYEAADHWSENGQRLRAIHPRGSSGETRR
jgi:hypothetical protein